MNKKPVADLYPVLFVKYTGSLRESMLALHEIYEALREIYGVLS